MDARQKLMQKKRNQVIDSFINLRLGGKAAFSSGVSYIIVYETSQEELSLRELTNTSLTR